MATDDFQAEIDRLIEKKRGELDALEATRRMFSSEKTTSYMEATTVEEGKVDLDSLGVETHDHGPTLAERVKTVLNRVPNGQEFTVPHVEALLKKQGYQVSGKNPRARLAMIMTQLEKGGLVIRTAKPKGFKPHKFKLAENKGGNISLVN